MTERLPKRSIPVPGHKDESGAYVRLREPTDEELSIDEMLRTALVQIHKLLQVIAIDITSQANDRDTVQSLKDCVSMLNALKEKESDILESMTPEQIEAAANGK